MNITDKLYTEWAWRTKTGVPNINNPEDKAILDRLINELTGAADGKISKKEVIAAIEQGEFTPEQLETLLNTISGVAYKGDVLEFLHTKGKAVSSIANRIYNVMVENGDIKAYHDAITHGKLPSYDSLGTEGNLKVSFSKLLSQDTINFLFDIKPQVGNIATGKGEVFLSVLTSDVTGDTRAGDVSANGKAIEVKNKGAKPYGQKAQYGTNSDKTFINALLETINKQLEEPLDSSITRGSRPFHRVNIILNAVKEQDSELVNNTLQAANHALTTAYPGLDLSDIKFQNYYKNGKLDADAFEQAFVKVVIQHYEDLEHFDEVLFLDDTKGSFAKVPADRLTSLVGSKLIVLQKDGLPRWSYKF